MAEFDVALAGHVPVGEAPGAQLRLWDTGGYRHQVTLTNSVGDAVALRRRRHARVENCIKEPLRQSGLDSMPFRPLRYK